jgi:hypothetical protein
MGSTHSSASVRATTRFDTGLTEGLLGEDFLEGLDGFGEALAFFLAAVVFDLGLVVFFFAINLIITV